MHPESPHFSLLCLKGPISSPHSLGVRNPPAQLPPEGSTLVWVCCQSRAALGGDGTGEVVYVSAPCKSEGFGKPGEKFSTRISPFSLARDFWICTPQPNCMYLMFDLDLHIQGYFFSSKTGVISTAAFSWHK